ncbi:hypothetical protein F2Q68_00040110 [Brassica cretica]|uniref:Uncharacterized protein n=1 Tax=Brassica cretica TaxID=69181 RepID=A0A8S9M9Q2_BRACR|nr:hypothetical protein F2Q68_00040110 [Brassica cretica]
MALIGYLSFGVSLDSFSGFSLSVALPSTATELPLGVSPRSTTATDNYLGGSPPIESQQSISFANYEDISTLSSSQLPSLGTDDVDLNESIKPWLLLPSGRAGGDDDDAFDDEFEGVPGSLSIDLWIWVICVLFLFIYFIVHDTKSLTLEEIEGKGYTKVSLLNFIFQYCL